MSNEKLTPSGKECAEYGIREQLLEFTSRKPTYAELFECFAMAYKYGINIRAIYLSILIA